MDAPVLLVTPPFTQLNTPYPATAYLKGFFNTKNIKSEQADLGIEVTLAIFCKEGLVQLFTAIDASHMGSFNANCARIVSLKERYINTIDSVIIFLQGKQPGGKLIPAKHLAELALFLCTAAGGQMNGAILPMENGWLAL